MAMPIFIDNFNEMSWLHRSADPPKILVQDLDLTSRELHNLKVSIPRRSSYEIPTTICSFTR